ncbi:hypothetical protein D3C86_2061420 [compost metagenome]
MKVFVEAVIAWKIFFQQEGFKEPSRMTEMPLWWRDLWRGLNTAVLDKKRCRNQTCQGSGFLIVLRQMGHFIPRF